MGKESSKRGGISLAASCPAYGGFDRGTGSGSSTLQVFGRALHAIARVSDEFWIDPNEKGAVLPLFRCAHTLERNVEKCDIYTDFNDCHIVFKLFCKHGVVKTHSLAFQECEPLQAVFSKHLCTNVLKVQSRQLSDILIHFPTYQDEVTLGVTPVKVFFRTYIEDEIDFAKATRTKIHLSPEEFEYFQVGVDSEVTFCLKELRGLLVFAEAISAPVSIHFDVSGKPVVFSIQDKAIEATFVLATLADTDSWTATHESKCISQGQIRRSDQAISSTRNIPSTETSTAPSEDFSVGEDGLPPDPSYHKFHSLFFGIVSPKEQSGTNLLCSLATVSDSEEDCGTGGHLSPTF